AKRCGWTLCGTAHSYILINHTKKVYYLHFMGFERTPFLFMHIIVNGTAVMFNIKFRIVFGVIALFCLLSA
ncbi:MAG: hypothetical protein ACNYZG_11645, partial [Gammaproteobacteria bacterium]